MFHNDLIQITQKYIDLDPACLHLLQRNYISITKIIRKKTCFYIRIRFNDSKSGVPNVLFDNLKSFLTLEINCQDSGKESLDTPIKYHKN